MKSVFKKMNSRKMKVFLLFLICSFLAWAISTLSEGYESKTSFGIVYENVPDSLLSKSNGNTSISAKIKASGFQFLSYALNPKVIRLDVQNVLEEDGDYFLTGNTVKDQIENQLPNRVSLVALDAPIHYTDLYLVDSKMVPILPKMDLNLAQNHVLQGALKVEPDSVLIKGPKKEIDQIKRITTLPVELSDVSSDFSKKLRLQPLDSLGNVVMGAEEAIVTGTVVRFSEKEFEIKLEARNVPSGYRVRMFPDRITLVCKAGIDRLKELQASDFQGYVDYKAIMEDKYLFVELTQKPEGVFSVRLLQNRIEFVLEKL